MSSHREKKSSLEETEQEARLSLRVQTSDEIKRLEQRIEKLESMRKDVEGAEEEAVEIEKPLELPTKEEMAKSKGWW